MDEPDVTDDLSFEEDGAVQGDAVSGDDVTGDEVAADGEDEEAKPRPRPRPQERWEQSEARRLKDQLAQERGARQVLEQTLAFLRDSGVVTAQGASVAPVDDAQKPLTREEIAELRQLDPDQWITYLIKQQLDQGLGPVRELVESLRTHGEDRQRVDEGQRQVAAVAAGMRQEIEQYAASQEGDGVVERVQEATLALRDGLLAAGARPEQAQTMVRDVFLGLFVRCRKEGVNYGAALDMMFGRLGNGPGASQEASVRRTPSRATGGPVGSLSDASRGSGRDHLDAVADLGGALTDEQIRKALEASPGSTPMEQARNFHARFEKAQRRRRA